MNKIRFADETELEVSSVTQAGDNLRIEVETSDVNALITTFKGGADTSRIMYYVGIDLLRGYAGYTRLTGVEYTPDVVTGIDYTTPDDTTESGFAETTVDKAVITLGKVDKVSQLVANLDYMAMATGVEL